MPRIPKRLLALGGLAAGGAAFVRSRRGKASPAPATPAAPAPAPPPATEAGNAAAAPVVAPPPPEAPGPSVTPPSAGGPASETERAEQAEATVPTPDPAVRAPVRHSDDDFVAAEEAAAAAEARNIGGPRLDDAHGDPAFEAAYEAGGGEAEGFEIAEDELIENATHGDGRADPIGDAFTPEVESDEQTAVDAEADEERVSELDEDDTDRR
jgi:hypothetical protein